ncbi:MBL fold metallo-hydrolase [Vagococcus bubulae]|uniref:Metallo-beta-lactamase domain-containing protein n=1 Tax=Vagococcus bubulae TaxID=1977868 RepID=A0A429ZML0_9ENTE|nr:MBL fold metallo-hydrolase [Vagococcus bubulae]RST94889.1 hypothetical protein CBF36_05020 [Vagococcus bubulae]
MDITVLGYWGGYPYQGEGTTSYLIQSDDFSLLLDAGSSTLVRLEEKLDPLTLDVVLLTHYHHDHMADLGVLQYLRQLKPTNPVEELPIYGHTENMEKFNELTMTGISKGIAYHETQELELGPFLITFKRTIHPVPCFATRIVEKSTGKVFVFTADTGYFEGLSDFCHEADLLITDTYFLEGNEHHKAHLTTKETGELAKQADVKQVVISHLNQSLDLNEVLKQTQYYAEDIPIQLAKINLNITL